MVKAFFNNHSSDLLGAIGGIGSFFGNQLSSAISSSRQWKYTQRAMALQDSYNRAFTRDSYGLMREGLEKAGYNPLLALGSSANSAMPGATAGISDSDIGDQAINSAIAMRSANAEFKRIQAETKGIETDNKIKEKQLEKLKFENNTNPRKIIDEAIHGNSPTINSAIKSLSNFKNKYGFSWLQPRNFYHTNTARAGSFINYLRNSINSSQSHQYKYKVLQGYVSKNNDYDYKSFDILPDRPEWKINHNEVVRRMRKR